MWFGLLTLATALIISVSAAYYSILGLTAIFAAAFWPIVILGSSLEVGKIVSTLWLHKYWDRAELQYKVYLCSAVAILMLLTSMGVFGFLSKAHSDQGMVSGDVQAKIAIYDEKIKQARDNIAAARGALQQMDAAVDQTMSRSNDERGAERAVQIRRTQAAERNRLLKEIDTEQKKIQELNNERAPIAAEVRKVEAEVGPIKYIAALIYGDNPDANLLEKAVRWVIILIVIVFDPLALTLLLAATKSLEWERGVNVFAPVPKRKDDQDDEEVGGFFDKLKERARALDRDAEEIKSTTKDSNTHIPVEDYYRADDGKSLKVWDEFFAGEKSFQDIDKEIKREGLEPDPLPVAKEKFEPSQPGWMFSKPVETVYDSESAPVPEPYVKKAVDKEHYDDVHVGMAKEAYKRLHPEEDLKSTQKAVEEGKETELPWARSDHLEALPISDGDRAALRQKLALQSDNAPPPAGNVTGFGINFPPSPNKGDLFLRVDRLPTELFKYNGQQWIGIDKSSTDTYAYDEKYIDLLIDKIAAGEYDVDLLSDSEQQQMQKRLSGRG